MPRDQENVGCKKNLQHFEFLVYKSFGFRSFPMEPFQRVILATVDNKPVWITISYY